MMMRLAEAAAMLHTRVPDADRAICGISTDSRTLAQGDLFVALRGERYDGHAFLESAKSAGAAAAVVDGAYCGPQVLPTIRVKDTRRALAELALAWRARLAPVLVAVAGSNGKTTTKEMIAAILRCHAGEANVLATAGNLNNDIGVPLTLLKLTEAHRYAVIELGMNHRGEIAQLAALARPTLALVTNAQREHLEFMESVKQVAAENADVYRALPADGTAVINADDPHAEDFRKAAAGRKTVHFGLEAPAEVSAGFEMTPVSSALNIRLPAGELRTELQIPGVHNVRNALAAAAAAYAAHIGPKAIAEGLGAFRPYSGRLQVGRAQSGATLIDDSYNANPDSVRAAIDVLAGAPGMKVLVLGDMGEVGAQGPAFHREIGSYAQHKGIDSLLALGEGARHAVDAFGAKASHFGTWQALAERACEAALPGATILVKGSRFMRMERVVRALQGGPQGGLQGGLQGRLQGRSDEPPGGAH